MITIVNFDDGNTVARNKKEIQELITLQRRYDTINAIREYKSRVYKDNTEDHYKQAEIQAQLISLFYEIDSTIEKDLEKKKRPYETSKEILDDIESENIEDNMKAWNYMNKLLYSLHLTQLDSQKEINWKDPEEVNEENEL